VCRRARGASPPSAAPVTGTRSYADARGRGAAVHDAADLVSGLLRGALRRLGRRGRPEPGDGSAVPPDRRRSPLRVPSREKAAAPRARRGACSRSPSSAPSRVPRDTTRRHAYPDPAAFERRFGADSARPLLDALRRETSLGRRPPPFLFGLWRRASVRGVIAAPAVRRRRRSRSPSTAKAALPTLTANRLRAEIRETGRFRGGRRTRFRHLMDVGRGRLASRDPV